MTYTRRRFLWAAGIGLSCATAARASTASALTRELRRMVGFQILAVDDVRQSWQRYGTRFIELRQAGLFRQVDRAIGADPPTFTDAVVFMKPQTRDYRLLIDGEFYQVVTHE